jgi:phosphatidylinositol alpha-1,6-mannosyltransferase
MGAWLKRARGVPALQTIASPPRSFDNPERLVFGDIVVAQSRWTRERLERSFANSRATAPRIEVIPPPVAALTPRTPEQMSEARQRLAIAADVPLFVYPGDVETSGGARAVRELVGPLRERIRDAVVVFAYRAKTEQAPAIALRLAEGLDPSAVRFASDLPDILALLASASAVLFPVDDLWGKVDLPIVLLESMDLGVPVILLDRGPLRDLDGVVKVPDTSQQTLLEATLQVSLNPDLRHQVIAEQKACILLRHRAATVSRAYERLYSELLTASRAYSLER